MLILSNLYPSKIWNAAEYFCTFWPLLTLLLIKQLAHFFHLWKLHTTPTCSNVSDTQSQVFLTSSFVHLVWIKKTFTSPQLRTDFYTYY